jgi:hypothetical protein
MARVELEYRDEIQYVAGRVAAGPAFKRRRRKERDCWVALRWIDMSKLFGKSGTWDKVRCSLIDGGVLQCEQRYVIGERAKWYRLAPEWRLRGVHLAPVTGKLLTRLECELAAKERDCVPRSPAVEWLTRWFKEVRVDETKITRWISQKSSSMKQHQTALQILAINSGLGEPVVCSYGRVHSSLTNIRRGARAGLHIHGEPLVEVDVSCAQPLILGFIVAKLLAGDWTVAAVKRLGSDGDISEPFKDLPMTRWSTELPPDLLDYFDCCQRSAFYSDLAEVWGMPCETAKEKNAIKGLTFRRVLFGRVHQYRSYWKAFAERWPVMAAAIELLKEHDHGTTARACQRLEARLMVDGVADRFRVEYPDIPVQLLHDGVLVTAADVELARAVIQAEFGNIGLAPLIKVKVKAPVAVDGPKAKRRRLAVS